MFGKQERKFADYELQQCLGEGLTSCVYKAIKKSSRWRLQQTVALKILKSCDQDQTLEQEVGLLTKVDSPHCVKLLGWTEHKNRPALILEYLEGVTLRQLAMGTKLPFDIVDEIICQIQKGLMDLQSLGLHHGDLSPQNIFITRNGVVKLLDFGFSCTTRPQGVTPAYLSPEGWEQKSLDLSSDLYSLGLIRQELLAGVGVTRREEAHARCLQSLNKDTLLQQDRSLRCPLPLETKIALQKKLAQLVLKESQAFLAATTLLQNTEVQKPTRSVIVFKKVACFMAPFFLYTQSLHPSAPIYKKQLYTIEVRSLLWADVQVYKVQATDTRLLKRHYTPLALKNLSVGTYKIQWKTQDRSGVISVQLKKNQRILVP